MFSLNAYLAKIKTAIDRINQIDSAELEKRLESLELNGGMVAIGYDLNARLTKLDERLNKIDVAKPKRPKFKTTIAAILSLFFGFLIALCGGTSLGLWSNPAPSAMEAPVLKATMDAAVIKATSACTQRSENTAEGCTAFADNASDLLALIDHRETEMKQVSETAYCRYAWTAKILFFATVMSVALLIGLTIAGVSIRESLIVGIFVCLTFVVTTFGISVDYKSAVEAKYKLIALRDVVQYSVILAAMNYQSCSDEPVQLVAGDTEPKPRKSCKDIALDRIPHADLIKAVQDAEGGYGTSVAGKIQTLTPNTSFLSLGTP